MILFLDYDGVLHPARAVMGQHGPELAGGGSLETLRRQREALYRICADYAIREDTAQAAAEVIAAIWREQV